MKKLAILLLFPLGGCLSSEGYFGDRWRDFAGILEADAGWSEGVQLYAGMSHVVQAGWGSHHGHRAGLRSGRLGSWEEERSEMGLGPLYLHEVDWDDTSEGLVGHQHAGYLDPGYVSPSWELGSTTTDRTVGDLGVAANIGFVGFSLRFKTLEFLDFLTGWFGLDLAGDDLDGRSRGDLIRALRSEDPETRLIAARLLAALEGKTRGYRSYSQGAIHTEAQKEAVAAWEKEAEGDN